MCRILVARIEGGSCRGDVRVLLEAFKRAASSDRYLSRITGGDGRHCNGGGYVFYAGSSVYHEKYDVGDCEYNLAMLRDMVDRLEAMIEDYKNEEILLILHARRASRGMPRGPIEAHPYHTPYTSPEGIAHLYLAHNGSINHEEIAASLGINPRGITDSHALALHIARRLSQGRSLEETIMEAKEKWLKTALVLGILIIEPGEDSARLYATTVLDERLDEQRRQYYMTREIMADGLHAVTNSIVTEYYEELGGSGEIRGTREEIIILK